MEERVPSYSIPIRSSHNAPGWLFVGEWVSCIPDVAYPPDPDVLRAIREFQPDVQPVTMKSVWKRPHYDGAEVLVIVHHGIARSITDLHAPPHFFDCPMPTIDDAELVLTQPNYVEENYYNRADRPLGLDMPGTYLPFDFDLYYKLLDGRRPDKTAEEITEEITAPRLREEAAIDARRKSNDDDFEKEENERLGRLLPKFSDREIVEYLTGTPEPRRETKTSVGWTKTERYDPAPAPL